MGYSVLIAWRGTGFWKHSQGSPFQIWPTDRHLADWQRPLGIFDTCQPQQQRHRLTFGCSHRDHKASDRWSVSSRPCEQRGDRWSPLDHKPNPRSSKPRMRLRNTSGHQLNGKHAANRFQTASKPPANRWQTGCERWPHDDHRPQPQPGPRMNQRGRSVAGHVTHSPATVRWCNERHGRSRDEHGRSGVACVVSPAVE